MSVPGGTSLLTHPLCVMHTAYRKPSAKAPVMRCLTEAVQSAMIGIDVLLPETGEVDGQQEAPTAEHAPHKEGADVSARTAPGGPGRAGCTPGRPPGNRAAILQRRTLRRAAAPAPHESRSRLASSPRHPPDTHAGAAGCLFGPAGAVRLLRVRLSRARKSAAGHVAGRAPGCGARPDARHPCLPGAQPRVCGQSPPRALQEPRARPQQYREQAQRYRAALCRADARWGTPEGVSAVAQRPARGADRLGRPGGHTWPLSAYQVRPLAQTPRL